MTPDQLAALHARCFSVPRPWSAAEFAAILADPLCFAMIESAGFLIGRAVAGEAEVLTLAVAPEARNLGVGARLVQGFLNGAKMRGAGRVFLEVAADNAVATRLYGRAGFREVGRRRGYYVPPDGVAVDALVLARAL